MIDSSTIMPHTQDGESPVVADELGHLLAEMSALRVSVIAGAATRLQRYAAHYPDGVFNDSAVNLAHYLSLRSQDLRPLQERLARAGLSSLGRGEPHVIANLERVIGLLRRAVGVAGDEEGAAGFDTASQGTGSGMLERHTDRLFGARNGGRRVRVMVTLPTEAAWDYAQVKALVDHGMDCARINCAHDEPALWEGMVKHVRRAAAEVGRDCKILMDLAGHKLRTGPLRAGPAVKRIKPQKDNLGRAVAPARIAFVPESMPAGSEATLGIAASHFLRLPDAEQRRLEVGDRLEFQDARQKTRHFEIVDRTESGVLLAHCAKTAYLMSGTPLIWRRSQSAAYNGARTRRFALCEFTGPPVEIKLCVGDHLLLTRAAVPGEPAQGGGAGTEQIWRPAHISCSLPEALGRLAPGDPVWIDDGRLGAVVEALTEEGAMLRVTQAGPKGVKLLAEKGLNFPETRLDLPSLSEQDLGDLDFVCRHADMVGFSFVETMEDMDDLASALAARGAPELPIIAKIETKRAVANLPEIILGSIGRHTVGVMIARGDLAVELGSVRLAEIQEEILWLCEAAHVPVIWATGVLESLAKKGISSRSEITDAAMGVRAECVMLNKGPYVVDAVKVLSNILVRMQAHQKKKISRLRALHW